MTSNETIEKLNKLELLVLNNSGFYKTLKDFSKIYPRAKDTIGIILANVTHKPITVSLESDPLKHVKDYINKLSLIEFAYQTHSITNDLKKLNYNLSGESAIVFYVLVEKLEKFSKVFESTIRDLSFINIFTLTQESYYLQSLIQNNILLTSFLKDAILTNKTLQKDETELSFHFTASIEYKTLIIKLIALEELYDEICRLLDVSTSQFPLRLVKLETGSWWIKVFGESKVITAIIGFTEKSVSYFHRTYTVEGKISKIPKDLEVIDKLLELSKSLEEHGIDATVLKDNIQHSAIVLSEQLNKLLVGEPNVKINEKEFYIGKDLDEKLLKERQTLLLESGESET